MKTKRFDFNFRPLQVDISFAVVGSVPPKQNFNADTKEYTPDYSLVPLTIQPTVGVLDKDGIIASGSVNSKLSNIRWRETIGGTTKTIETSNTAYTITQTGANAGRIQVKKNAAPSNPITLEFSAEYIDPRTSQIYNVLRTFLIKCDNATPVQPRVVLDAAEQTLFNPLKDADDQVVTARLLLGEEEAAADTREFVWEKCRKVDGSNVGNWTAIGSDGASDGSSYTENLLLKSGVRVETDAYNIKNYSIIEAPDDKETCTITIWGELGEGKTKWGIFNNTGNAPLVYIESYNIKEEGVYTKTFKWTKGGDALLIIYAIPNTATTVSRIDRIKLERGENKNPVWTPAKGEAKDDYDVTISADTTTATIHRRLMGDRIDIRCRAKYSGDGAYKSVALTDASPSKAISVIRRIPKFEFDMQGVPTNIPADSQTIAPIAVVRDTNGDIANFDKELLPLWYIATNKASGALTYTQVAHGKAPILSTAPMSKDYGAVVGLDVIDLGPLAKMVDPSGNIYTDASGEVLLIR